MESPNLSNVKILEYYGSVNPPEGPRWSTVRCPFHEDKNASARSNGKGFICMGCGVQGDGIKLVQEREGLGYLDSIEFIERVIGEDCQPLRGPAKQQRRRPNTGELSEAPRNYERNSSIFQVGSRKRPTI